MNETENPSRRALRIRRTTLSALTMCFWLDNKPNVLYKFILISERGTDCLIKKTTILELNLKFTYSIHNWSNEKINRQLSSVEVIFGQLSRYIDNEL